MFKKATMTLGLIAVLATGVGCSRATETQKWAATGAVVGGVAGAWLGDTAWHSVNTVQSGLIGAAGGGLVGALYGDARDQANGNSEFEAALRDKDSKIAAAQEAERAASAKLAAANQDIANKDREIARLTKANADLMTELANCRGMRVQITLSADVLFNSGSATLSAGGRRALDQAIEQIGGSDKLIMVEGHTDTDPIRATSNQWKDNFDLGAARALTVLRYLQASGKIPAERLSAATFGEYQPVGADKAQNRRAVIVLYSNSK